MIGFKCIYFYKLSSYILITKIFDFLAIDLIKIKNQIVIL